jgi:hypothetical protein
MRVQFHGSDDLAFLERKTPVVTIDTGTLTEIEQRLLEELVRNARFFELPSMVTGTRGGYRRACHITIEDRHRQHSITVREPVQGPALRRLIDGLRQLGSPRRNNQRTAKSA